MNRLVRVSAFVLSILLSAAAARAQDGSNVLVVLNDATPQFKEIAGSYLSARRIPADHLLHIRTAADDEIDRLHFEAEIERPIIGWLISNSAQDRILYIVLVKGVPLRVRGTGGLSGTVASVDSELTLLYRKMVGISAPPTGRIANPYFQADKPLASARPFSHADYDIYLVTRLDGFTVADVLREISNGAAPVRQGSIVLDQRANLLGEKAGDIWLATAAQRLAESGSSSANPVVFETTPQVATGKKQVLGFYSWGSNDAAVTKRHLDIQFVPGALAGMFVSTDARTFKEPPETWTLGKWQDSHTFFAGSPQSLTGDLIRDGVTGVVGHVAEPYLDATVRPQVLFPAYLSGFNLAESFYLAMPYLSWESVVIGDPLCAPFRAQTLTSEQTAPASDPATELPKFFSTRRLDALEAAGADRGVAALLLKGDSLLLHGDLDGARGALEAVTAIQPALTGAQFVLAGIYEGAGQYDLAIERYRTMLKIREDDVRAMNNLAYALAVHKHDLKEALQLADRVYRIASGRDLVVDLGYSTFGRGSVLLKAVPFMAAAMNLENAHAQIADTLGWVHHLSGNDAAAEPFLVEAATGTPGNAVVQLHLAVALAGLGRDDEAQKLVDKALQLDPALEKDNDMRALRARLRR